MVSIKRFHCFVFNKTKSTFRLIPSPIIRNPPTRPTIRRPAAAAQPQIGAVASRDGKCQLQILAQPEQQHRARYQTEGSRGAVKDRSGNGFPIVKLTGYTKPTVLEVSIELKLIVEIFYFNFR